MSVFNYLLYDSEDPPRRMLTEMDPVGGTTAAIATMAGCAPTPVQAQASPAGVPWVQDAYANGKWVPGHCLGQPAQ